MPRKITVTPVVKDQNATSEQLLARAAADAKRQQQDAALRNARR